MFAIAYTENYARIYRCVHKIWQGFSQIRINQYNYLFSTLRIYNKAGGQRQTFGQAFKIPTKHPCSRSCSKYPCSGCSSSCQFQHAAKAVVVVQVLQCLPTWETWNESPAPSLELAQRSHCRHLNEKQETAVSSVQTVTSIPGLACILMFSYLRMHSECGWGKILTLLT